MLLFCHFVAESSTALEEYCPFTCVLLASSFLQLVKDYLGPKTPAMCSVPCECGQVFVGHAGHSLETKNHRTPSAYLFLPSR